MDPLPLGRCSQKYPREALGQCHRWANLVCGHCRQPVCLEHQKMHEQEVEIQAERLNNQVNDLRQVLHSLSHERMIENLQEEIERWARQCKAEIDRKCVEMMEQGSKRIKGVDIDDFRLKQLNKIDKDVGQPLIGLLRSPRSMKIEQVKMLQQRLEEIEKEISFLQINNDGQLTVTSASPICKYSLCGCPGAMAGSSPSHHYLLIFQSKPSFSLILIEENQLRSQITVDYFVHDISWCQSTQVFLIATEHHLYEFHPLTHRLALVYEEWTSTGTLWSLACHLTDVYIIHKPDLILSQREMKKSYEKKRAWMEEDILCEKDDRTIGCIRIDEQQQLLALSIKQADHQWRVDLFSMNTMQRLHRGASFNVSEDTTSEYCMLVSLLADHRQWLVQISQTILLDEQAQVIRQIDRSGSNVTLMGKDRIAILNQTGVDIYHR